MDVARDSGSGCLSDVHPEVYSIGCVELAQNGLHSLREFDHFMSGFRWQLLQLVKMGKGNNHYVPWSIRVCIQDNITMGGAMDDPRFDVVSNLWKITEYAAGDLFRCGDIGVAPRGPQIVHGGEVSRSCRGTKTIERDL